MKHRISEFFQKLFGSRQASGEREEAPWPAGCRVLENLGPGGSIDHPGYWSGGLKVQWRNPETGEIRVPEELNRSVSAFGPFTAGCRTYRNLSELETGKTQDPQVFQDAYGRQVLRLRERFPCFDSYDYASEDRHFHWYYLKDGEKLVRIYYADDRKEIQITEDVGLLEQDGWEAMAKRGLFGVPKTE